MLLRIWRRQYRVRTTSQSLLFFTKGINQTEFLIALRQVLRALILLERLYAKVKLSYLIRRWPLLFNFHKWRVLGASALKRVMDKSILWGLFERSTARYLLNLSAPYQVKSLYTDWIYWWLFLVVDIGLESVVLAIHLPRVLSSEKLVNISHGLAILIRLVHILHTSAWR